MFYAGGALAGMLLSGSNVDLAFFLYVERVCVCVKDTIS